MWKHAIPGLCLRGACVLRTDKSTGAQGTSAQILETRKTAPGLRLTDKWAVLIGGGTNHRIGLFDMVMIKDNHVTAAGGVVSAIQHAQVQHMLQIAPYFALATLTWSGQRVTMPCQLMG